MARESLDRLREALTRLPTASRADLKAEWRRLYRSEPPARLVTRTHTVSWRVGGS